MLASNCGGITHQSCMDYCNGHFDWFARCSNSYETFLQCSATIGQFECVNGGPEQTNCFDEWDAFWTCTWKFTPTCNVPNPGPSGGNCYAGAGCNPVSTDFCGANYACTWVGSGEFQCHGPGAFTAGLCDSCATADCQPGLECAAKDFTECARYCCSDADCGGTPGSCIEVGYFSDTRFCGTYICGG